MSETNPTADELDPNTPENLRQRIDNLDEEFRYWLLRGVLAFLGLAMFMLIMATFMLPPLGQIFRTEAPPELPEAESTFDEYPPGE